MVCVQYDSYSIVPLHNPNFHVRPEQVLLRRRRRRRRRGATIPQKTAAGSAAARITLHRKSLLGTVIRAISSSHVSTRDLLDVGLVDEIAAELFHLRELCF